MQRKMRLRVAQGHAKCPAGSLAQLSSFASLCISEINPEKIINNCPKKGKFTTNGRFAVCEFFLFTLRIVSLIILVGWVYSLK